MLTLEETSKLMLDDNYKNRLIAEYWQVRQRREKLEKYVLAYPTLDNKPKTPLSTFCLQLKFMNEYQAILETRAAIENIDLENDLEKQQEKTSTENLDIFFNTMSFRDCSAERAEIKSDLEKEIEEKMNGSTNE